jgi:hypothetical protein
MGQSSVGGSMDVWARLFEGADRAGYLQDMRSGALGLHGALGGHDHFHLGGDQSGARNVYLTQNNHTTIEGSGDPRSVAREVVSNQIRVNGQLTRNLQKAIA